MSMIVHTCGIQKTAGRWPFSPSTMWVLEIELGLSSKLSCHPALLLWFCAEQSEKPSEDMRRRQRQGQPVCWVLQVPRGGS